MDQCIKRKKKKKTTNNKKHHTQKKNIKKNPQKNFICLACANLESLISNAPLIDDKIKQTALQRNGPREQFLTIWLSHDRSHCHWSSTFHQMLTLNHTNRRKIGKISFQRIGCHFRHFFFSLVKTNWPRRRNQNNYISLFTSFFFCASCKIAYDINVAHFIFSYLT